nr:uncharacterized protein LOC126539581 isoform X2 [Dermacentor andersoni]
MHRLVKFPWTLLLLAAACAAQNLVSMEECARGNGVPGFKNFTIYPCDSDPCVITRGETYNVTFFAEATANANVVMLSTSVHQQSNATLVQVGQTVSCHFRDFPCNVTKGELFRGSYNFGLSFGTFTPEEVTYWVQVGTYQAMFACGRVNLIVE